MSFPYIRVALLVGIGGGVPSDENDIRLGDVVVSQPNGEHGGVVQYQFASTSNPASTSKKVGTLDPPTSVLANAIAVVGANHFMGKSNISRHLARLEEFAPQCRREKAGVDYLFPSNYDHVPNLTCKGCDPTMRVSREPRGSGPDPVIHRGTIASVNRPIKDAKERDQVSFDLGDVLCFETEATGLANAFPCVLIRGISSYSDSHKYKKWQLYAAAVAAAYAKELVSTIPATEVASVPKLGSVDVAKERIGQENSGAHQSGFQQFQIFAAIQSITFNVSGPGVKPE